MILVLSGTKDGRIIINKLLEKGFKVLATTTTEYGKKLIGNNKNLKVISKSLNKSEMKDLLISYDIDLIIDCTHPYAEEASKNIIFASKDTSIKYIRYERERGKYNDILSFDTFKECTKYLKATEGNILLTTGSNNLKVFVENININRLYIRVLPTSKVIKKCENLGFIPKQILALQGPFNKGLNREIYKQYNIKHMITKDSGDIGGTKEKIESAKEIGIEPIVINRPVIDYGEKFFDVDEMLKKIVSS